MAKSVLELAVGTGQWDAGLKKAKNALDNFTQANGGLQSALNKDSASMQTFVQMMGKMDSTAKTAKGQMNDYKGTIEQLTMQYNRMTDAQKAAVGQTYLQAIDQMKQKYQGVAQEVAKINQELKQTNELSAGTGSGGGGLFSGDKLSGMLQVFGGNVMTKVAGMGVGFVSELGDMVKQGIELARAGEGVRLAFERLGRGDLLDGLRQATHGTVTDLELMKAAVKFNDFKLPLEELGTMLAFAQQKAKDTGQSVDYMVDSIVTGLGRKSLMILDNLGLSAAEIKDKMKDTGDMTKAVGEIIREQMQKAGDYVETAADRATKANVELKNAMTRLGETFQPLSDSATSMWTDIKVGALDLLNNAIKPLVEWLTKAGQLKAEVDRQGGNTKVDADIEKLKGSNYKPQAYQMMLAGYFSNENQARNNLLEAQKGGKGSIAIWQNQYDAAKSMREMFQTAAQKILNPVSDTKPLPVEIKTSGGGGGRNSIANIGEFVPGEGVKNAPPEFKPMWDTAIFQEALRKELGMDGEQTRDWGKELGQVFADYVADPDKEKRDKANKNEKDLVNKMSTLTSGLSTLTSGIKGLGIDLPKEVDDVIGIISSLTSIIQGVQTIISIFGNTAMAANTAAIIANTAALTANTATNLLPFAHGGIVPHAANGYYVPGTHASGDVTPILANAGELVLNKSSQNNLANELKGAEALLQTLDRYQTSIMRGSQYNYGTPTIGGGMLGNMKLETMITGEQIRLVLNNNGRRTGRGEYITTNFK